MMKLSDLLEKEGRYFITSSIAPDISQLDYYIFVEDELYMGVIDPYFDQETLAFPVQCNHKDQLLIIQSHADIFKEVSKEELVVELIKARLK